MASKKQQVTKIEPPKTLMDHLRDARSSITKARGEAGLIQEERDRLATARDYVQGILRDVQGRLDDEAAAALPGGAIPDDAADE